jgi:hypothetical protein
MRCNAKALLYHPYGSSIERGIEVDSYDPAWQCPSTLDWRFGPPDQESAEPALHDGLKNDLYPNKGHGILRHLNLLALHTNNK